MKQILLATLLVLFITAMTSQALAADGPCGKIESIQRQSYTGVLFTVTLKTGEKLAVREDFSNTPLVTAMAADLTVCFRKLGPETYLTDSFSK